MRRRSVLVALLVALLLAAAGCGAGEPGFLIDQVSINPDDIPLNSQSTDEIRIAASVINDRHEVVDVLVTSDEGSIWIEMVEGRYPRWSGSVPVAAFYGFPIGDYWFDFEARDTTGRTVSLEDAVRLEILED